MIRAALAGGLALAAAACVALPHPSPADAVRAQARWPTASATSLEEGRTTFVRRCAGCHRLPLPRHHTATDWPRLLTEMGRRAKLLPPERELIERFLVTLADRPVEPR